jgi:hypothetical protein
MLLRSLEKSKSKKSLSNRGLLWRCTLLSIWLLLCTFPDVIFMRASVSNASLTNVTADDGHKKVQLFPERKGRQPWEGYYDFGGGSFQSDPAIQFVRRSLQSGQSIFWNPYSATGSYGPETLVDIKTSPITMMTAVLGGGDLAFHVIFLGFNFIAVFCLLVLFTIEFRLSLVAALGGGVTYLMNGYYVANLGSNVSQVWLYFPVLTLILVSFARHPNAIKLVGISCAAVLILATTFLPTMIITLGTALLVGAAASFGNSMVRESGLAAISWASARLIAGQWLGVALALLSLAIVYLPIFEAMKYMGTSEFYAARKFYAANLFNLISLFTPKHAFEAYSAITPRADQMRGSAAFHQGIIGALLATQVMRTWSVFQRVVIGVVLCTLFLLVARIYGLPGFSSLIDALPLLGNLGEQYLWISVGLLFTISVAFGIHGLLNDGVRLFPLLIGAIAIGAALAYTTKLYGLENVTYARYLWVATSLIVAGAAMITFRSISRAPTVLALCLIVLSWGELTFYVDHYRLQRYDRFLNPAPFVRFLQNQGGLHRVASYGQLGIPPEYGSAFGIYQIGSMNFQLFPRYADLFNRLILPDPKDRWTTFATLILAPDVDSLNLRGYDFLGVRFLLVSASYPRLRHFMEGSGWKTAYQDALFVIYENPDPMPRAFIVHQVSEGHETPLDIGKSPLAVATSDDPVLLAEARTSGLLGDGSGAPGKTEQAQITRYDHTRVEISANVTQTGVLVLNDAWHPNWRVWVDGSEQHLAEVNEAFRGVVLEQGKHTVEMRYAPRTFVIGSILSILGLATMLFLVLFRSRIDRRLAALVGASQTEPAKLQVAQAGQ